MTDTGDVLARTLASIFERDRASETPSGNEWPNRLWDEIVEGGFAYLQLDDDSIGLDELVAVARTVGQHAAPVPLVDTAGITAWALASAGLAAPERLTIATAHGFDDLRATPLAGGDLELSGTLHRVPWGRYADHLVTIVNVEDRDRVVLMRRPAEVRPGYNLAREPRDAVFVDRQRIPASAVGEASPSSEELRARGALLRAASAAGAMERVLSLTLDYADAREQFGKPIGTFQSVQRHLVVVAEASAATWLAVQAAVAAAPSHRIFAAASAAVTAGEESRMLARSAHQVFGAIGTTEEHALHRYTTRLWSWQDEYGTSAEWSRFIGRKTLVKSLPSIWSLISSTDEAFEGRGFEEAVPW